MERREWRGNGSQANKEQEAGEKLMDEDRPWVRLECAEDEMDGWR